MALLKLRSWFNWNTRWAPSVTEIPDPGSDSNIFFTVPDDRYIELHSLHYSIATVAGIRSSSTYALAFRGSRLLYPFNDQNAIASSINYRICWCHLADAVSAALGGYTNYLLSAAMPIFLEPGDRIEIYLNNPIAGDEIHTAFLYGKTWRC